MKGYREAFYPPRSPTPPLAGEERAASPDATATFADTAVSSDAPPFGDEDEDEMDVLEEMEREEAGQRVPQEEEEDEGWIDVD